MITERTAAIISAYTGITFGDFGNTRDYIEELMEKDPDVNPFAGDDSVANASKSDFIAIKVDDNDPTAMTEREAAIVTAFTGIALGNFGAAHLYMEEVMGHPIWTHELASPLMWKAIKEKSKADFIALSESVGNEPAKPVNYVQTVLNKVGENLPGLPDELLDLYTLLAMVKGEDVTLKDVHDAWAVWKNRIRADHKSLVPFEALEFHVQELDRKYAEGIAKAAK
ncbi:hypothetical protein SEA_LIMPID_201 [Streptomyces phage Limpid]|uniref:Uncharacterized protein n=1 Tax=Streptomyces phage Limpid TaxID=2653770 RepID=A0A5Q2WLX0_9CAUD|nr:hypothetical protein SEA_LIMPID_201 [Streptomyces phage Limpid]